MKSRSPATFRYVRIICLAFNSAVCALSGGQTPAEALDSPGLIWNNPAGTLVQRDVTFDGEDAVRLSRTGSTALSTSVTGPARVELKVRTSTELYADRFEASAGGILQAVIHGETDWQTVVLDVPSGSQRIDLIYRRDAQTTAGADAVWVDSVRVLPPQPQSTATVVDADFAGEPVITGLNATAVPLSARLAALEGGELLLLRPVAGAASGTVKVRVPVSGPGILSAGLKFPATPAGSVTAGGSLKLLGSPVFGTADYTTVEFLQPLDGTGGNVEFSVSIASGKMALLDRLHWTPIITVSPSEALDAGADWQTAGVVLAAASAGDASDGVDSVVLQGTDAVLSLTMTGPVQITWSSLNNPVCRLDSAIRVTVPLGTTPAGWKRESLFVPPGSHTLRWNNNGTAANTFSSQGRLDAFVIQRAGPVAAGDAADAPQLAWSAAPSFTGVGPTVDSIEGGDAIHSSIFPAVAGEWIEAAGNGSGLLAFAWRGSLAFAPGGADLLIGPLVAGSQEWSRVAVDLGDSPWTGRWQTKASATLTPALDAVRFTPGNGARLSSVAECGEEINVVYAAGRNAAGPVDGWDGAPGSQIYMDGSPALMLKTSGSGVLRMRAWLTSGTALTTPAGTVTGTGTWQDVEMTLNGSPSVPALRLFSTVQLPAVFAVDGISWTAGNLYSSSEAMDTPGVTWTSTQSGTTEGWLGRSAPLSSGSPGAPTNPGDTDAMVVPELGPGASASLKAMLAGTGWLSWFEIVPSGLLLEVYADGQKISAADPVWGSPWRTRYAELGPGGVHEVEFRVSNPRSTALRSCAVHGVRITPWVTVPDAGYANIPDSWNARAAPYRRWERGSQEAVGISNRYLQSESGDAPCVLELSIPGPSMLTFYASADQVLLNGTAIKMTFAGQLDYAALPLPLAGENKLRLLRLYSNTAAFEVGTFETVANTSLADSLDQPGWNWSLSGGPWINTPVSMSADGVDAADFRGLAGTTTELTVPFPGPGLLTFRSASSGFGDVVFTHPGTLIPSIRYETSPWKLQTFAMNSTGPGEMKWSIPGADPGGPGNGFRLDDVRYFPFIAAGFDEALETPGRTWTASPAGSWRAASDPAASGEAADFAASVPPDDPSNAIEMYLSTPVTLPVWVEYEGAVLGGAGVSPGLPGNDASVLLGNNASVLPDVPGGNPARRRAFVGGSGSSLISFTSVARNNFSSRLERVFIGSRVGLGEAMDTTGLTWTAPASVSAGGIQTPDAANGGDAAVLNMFYPNWAAGYHISTTLAGPGTFSFKWKAVTDSNHTRRPFAFCRVDGAVARVLHQDGVWQEVRHSIGAGNHAVRMESEVFGCMVLADDFRFMPGGSDPIAAALDFPGASYGGSGDTPWAVTPQAEATGGSVMRTADGTLPGSRQTLAMAAAFGGNLQFRWRMQPGGDNGNPGILTLLVDGFAVWAGRSSAGWETAVVPLIGPGEHAIEWQWKSGDNSAFAEIDAVSLVPFARVPLAEALDTPGRSWITYPCAGCGGLVTSGTADGTDALGLDSELSFIQTTVTGPAKISFQWLTGENPDVKLDFRAGDFWVVTAGSSREWKRVELAVPAGVYSVSWQLTSRSPSPVTAMLDMVSITPAGDPESLTSALDLTGAVLVSSPGWQAVALPAAAGQYALASTAGGEVTLRLPGSGVLEFAAFGTNDDLASFTPVSGISRVDREITGRTPSGIPGFDFIRYRFDIETGGSGAEIAVSPPARNGMTSVIDDVHFTFTGSLTLDKALDSPAGTGWRSAGSRVWVAERMTPSPGGDDDRVILGSQAAAGEAILESGINGPFALSISGPSAAIMRVEVDGINYGTAGADIIYIPAAGAHSVRIVNAVEARLGPVELHSAVISLNPPPPWQDTPGLSVASTEDSGVMSTVMSVSGPGVLEFIAAGSGIITSGPGFTVPVAVNHVSAPFRMEVPAAGLREIRLTGNAGLRRVVWTQGATPFADACGLQDIALFWPADQMSATPGGGVSADLPAYVAGIVAAAGSGPAHCTWWQQTNVDTTYSSRISSVLSSGAITIPADAEAGPQPAMEGPAAWVPREMDWEPLPGSLYWILEGKVSIANIRITRPPEVTLESALELPPGVSVSPAAPGTAVGFKYGPAAGGDAVALRDGPRALALTAEGPGILSLDRLIWTGVNAPAAPLKIAVDAYPALDFSGKRGHLLLGSGLHTIFLGCAQIFNAACRLDNLAFLPLSFDPLQALGANIPILVTGNGEPAAWPFVSTRGTAGFPLPAGSSLLVSSPGPAFFSFEAAAEIRVSYPFASPPPVQVWPLGSPAVWLDRAATLSFNPGAAGSSSVSGIRMTPLNTGASISLPEALDAGELSITASPGLLPHRNAGLSVIGGDAAAFAAGTPARYLETKVTGPGRVRFWWRARGASLNGISFKINGTLSSGYSQYLWKLMDLPVTAGVKTLRWSVDDAATSAEMDGLQWFPEWSFAAWSAQNVLSSIPSAATRAASDSDHDGVSGLLEFAFGLDPAAPDHHYGSGLLAGPENGRGLPLLQPVTGADGLRYLAFDFPRRINAGITYQMQAANAAVGAWQNTGTLEVLRPLGPDWEMCRFSDSLPVSASRPLRFVRLKVSQP